MVVPGRDRTLPKARGAGNPCPAPTRWVRNPGTSICQRAVGCSGEAPLLPAEPTTQAVGTGGGGPDTR